MGLLTRRRRPEPRMRDTREDWTTIGGPRTSFPLSVIGSTTAAALSAAETGIGLLDRALMNSRIEAVPYTDLITPALLGGMARGMIIKGEQAALLSVDRGMPRLRLVRHDWIQSTAQREVLYITVPRPMGDEYMYADLADVAIPHWSTDPERPWRGVSPLDNVVSQLGAGTGAVLNRETRAAHGYLLNHQLRMFPGDGDFAHATTAEIQANLTAKFGDPSAMLGTEEGFAFGPEAYGRLMLGASGEGFLGKSLNQQGEQSRFGMNPPAVLKELVEAAEKCTLAALGVPSNLFSESLEPGRDSYRRYLTSTAQPIATKIAGELSRVLEVPVSIDLSPGRTSDELVSRARAVGSLAAAGVDVGEAMVIAGLEEAMK